MFRRIWRSFWVLWLLLALLAPLGAAAQDPAPLALLISADGPLTPAMGEYLKRGIRQAERRGAEVLIFQLDTPGGSVDLMTEMVQWMRASSVPIAVYVAPRGAMAGSAGTVITLAGHVAAMAPETAIGAASPVGSGGEELGETMEAKTKNILKAQVRSLAEERGPEAVALAESTIEEAEAVSANEALEAGLIDYIATDVYDLLRQMDGMLVRMEEGERTLNTAEAQVETLDQSFIEQLLAALTNPNIVFLLITIGVQAILIEISAPGGWVTGFIGVVCLSLAAYGLGVLPVNWFGIIFVALAFVLFILEIKAPTHGALTAAGIGSLIVGALVLFNSPGVPDFQRVSIPLIVGVSLATGAMFFVIVSFGIRAQFLPHRMGQDSMVGRIGVVHYKLDPSGIIHLGGEQWSAELLPGEEPLEHGERVEVVEVRGIKLYVRKVEG